MVATNQRKKDLFGGAFRCAGLAAAAVVSSSALADFTPAAGYNWTYMHAEEFVAVYASDYTLAAAFPPGHGYFGAGLGMLSVSGPTYMGTSITIFDSNVWVYAHTVVNQYFTVDSAKQVVFDWNFTDADTAVGVIENISAGNYVVGPVLEGTSGTMFVTLTPGNVYRFYGEIFAGFGSGGFVMISNVPAPGALAMLGVGMLGTRRRRRA